LRLILEIIFFPEGQNFNLFDQLNS
jgi:hypothetical protein